MLAFLLHLAVFLTGLTVAVAAAWTMVCAQLCYGWRGAAGYLIGSTPFALVGLATGMAAIFARFG